MKYHASHYHTLPGRSQTKKNILSLLLLKTKQISCFLVLFASCCVTPLFAEEELEIVLSTQTVLSPLYLSQFFNEKTRFSNNYLDNLRHILQFDLNNNGYTTVLDKDPAKESLLRTSPKEAFNSSVWQRGHVSFVVKVAVSSDRLITTLFVKDKNSFVSLKEINLSGNLSSDREKIHYLADTILEKLFGQKGVSSSKLLYSVRTPHPSQKNQWISEIWMCDWDGANAKQLTFEHSYCVHPVFVPQKGKSQHFIYVSYLTGQPKIYFSNIYSKKVRLPVVDLRGNQLLPSISPQGDKIALVSDAGGRPDLFLQFFNYRKGPIAPPLQLFSFPRATQASSTFSPDGSKMAFVSDKDGSPRIYLCALPDSPHLKKRPEAYLITKENRENVTPTWSPDGKKLAYSAKTDGVRQIWIYDFEKNNEWQLTNGGVNKENPFWAPDSLHLIYNTEDDYSSELYLININQKESIKITSGPGKKRFPAWEPFN